MARTRNYCFTINNPTGLLVLDPIQVKACWYQEEIGESGTYHFQGYVEFVHPISMINAHLIDGFENAALFSRNGTRKQAIDYCTKPETRVGGPYLFGNTEDMIGSGKRTDLHAFMSDVKNLKSKDDLFEIYPSIFARYPRWVCSVFERYRILALPPTPTFSPLPGWQSNLFQTLSEQPHARQVIWILDDAGNSGKSYFASNYQPHGYTITGGKTADIFYAYNFEPVVFFDWPRDAADRFPYAVAESFKNGYALSTKYETKRLRFAVPHVIILANFSPDLTKLSTDRWNIINVLFNYFKLIPVQTITHNVRIDCRREAAV